MKKIIKFIYLENTNQDESNKIQYDYVFSYVYGVKDSQSYDVNSAYCQNVATYFGTDGVLLGRKRERNIIVSLYDGLSTLNKKNIAIKTKKSIITH